MDGEKHGKRNWKEEREKYLKRQRIAVTVDSVMSGMCRDVRLKDDPSIPVLRVNAAECLDDPCREVRLNEDPNIPVVRVNAAECLDVPSFEALATRAPSGDPCLEMKTLVFVDSEEDGQGNKHEVNVMDTPSASVPVSVCPIPTCTSTDKKIRRHVYQKHLPFLFGEKSLDSVVLEKKYMSVTSLIQASLGFKTSWEDAVKKLNDSNVIPQTSEIHQTSEEMNAMCRYKGWNVPDRFTLHPINSPAVLLHWRCLVALLLYLTGEQQVDWCLKGRIAVDQPVAEGTSVSCTTMAECPSVSCTIPVEDVTEEEFSEMILIDEYKECESDENNNPDDLHAFDSHFHLDRTSRKIFGSVKSIKEVLSCTSFGLPNLPGKLVGGVMVYSEPLTYPNKFYVGKWKFALGVHPKHVQELTVERFLYLQSVIHLPEIAALGEIGLDRTVSPKYWSRQDETFRKVLALADPSKPIILHLRGPVDDHIGMDVNARALQIMLSICQRDQLIHLHCFTGNVELVQLWTEKFNKIYFGYTAAVQNFNKDQLQGLKCIPSDRILLETDSPYMSPKGKGCNTPAFIGDVASLVAAHRDVPATELLRQTSKNGYTLYGQ